MPNQIYALILIALATLPNFSYKAELESKITEQLIGAPKIVQITNQNTDKVSIPEKMDPISQATSYAKAAYFIDYNSGEVLYARNEKERLPMASTTKLMTALIAQEKLKGDQDISVKSLNTLPLDSVMGLAVGDILTTTELLHGLLIESGSDAAGTLAIASSDSEQLFVAAMNEKASLFGLKDTQFTNSVGHDGNGHYSTAKDLAMLSRIALSNKQISEIVSKKTYVATATSGKKYYLSNTNQLLTDNNFKGVKTGTTYAAGECLITLYDDGERKILGVVITSPDRFGETRSIIEWTKRVFSW